MKSKVVDAVTLTKSINYTTELIIIRNVAVLSVFR